MRILNGLLLLLFCATANAGLVDHISFGTGMVNRTAPPSGIWWQKGYEYSFDLVDSYLSLSLEKNVTSNFSIRGGYVDFGGYTTQAKATPEEDQLANGTCTPSTCRYPDLYVTRGTTRGFELVGTLKTSGKKGASVHAGAAYLRKSFDLTATGLTSDSQYGEGKSYHYTETRHGVGYMFGAGLFYNDVEAGVSVYSSSDDFNNKVFPSAVEPMVVAYVRYGF